MEKIKKLDEELDQVTGGTAIPYSVQPGDTLNAEIVNGQIILTPGFRRRSLRERAAAYGGQLFLSDEMEREEPSGSEVW